MTKPGDLKWKEFYKSNNSSHTLRKTVEEKVPSAQYHQDKPTGTLHKNAFSGKEEVNQKPAVPINKPGEIPRRPTNLEISQVIMANMPKSVQQPTHAEMVKAAIASGIQKTPEEMAEKQKDWENSINDFYKSANKPIEKLDSEDNKSWGSGKSFNDDLSEEELKKRNMYVEE